MLEVFETIQPDYTIKQFGQSSNYAITKFHRSKVCIVHTEKPTEYENKLENSISRARSMVKQYGLSNPWDFFCTLTLDSERYNRFDLDKFSVDLKQFFRDERKRYISKFPDHSKRLSFLLIPEMHKDGAWHMHGFFNGIPDTDLAPFDPAKHPKKLIKGGFLNWPRYASKFGFCSLGRIRDKDAAVFYSIKYITKDLDACKVKGRHLYFASRPLEKAVHVADSYGSQPELDKLLTWEGKFCSTGLATGKSWWWSLQFDDDDVQKLILDKQSDAVPVPASDPIEEFINLSFW